MRDTVRAYIEKYQLLEESCPVLVGLSGGADSIALLTLLVKLGYSCIAAHCNFHLRGEESMRDERFAEEYAKILQVPFLKTDFDTEQYAAANHLSIEMAARELRYNWFEEKRSETGAQAIAVAHHRDDSVETVLMNLVRGTGIRGMSGIRPKNGYVVRPLLCVTRKEITAWLDAGNISYVTDSTNLSDAYTRNFIRLRILPLLEEINPSVRTAIARTADHLSAAEAVYMHVVEQAKAEVLDEGNRISIPALMHYPSPDAILYELLKAYNFSRTVSEDIYASLEGEPGKLFFSPTHRLVKDRDYLLLSSIETKPEQTYVLSGNEEKWVGPVELSFNRVVISENFHIRKDKNIAYFDYDKLAFPLTLRTWKDGDWFIPFGMKGRKKLSDYFSERKFSRFEKERVWLLCSGNDIIWIVGERPDNRYSIGSATKCALIVNFFSTKTLY
ncbi:MAG: tRNA(Ile)-lysidine synthase [Parabacteroides sp.]